eukprot:916246-Rhodomonas_salina.3
MNESTRRVQSVPALRSRGGGGGGEREAVGIDDLQESTRKTLNVRHTPHIDLDLVGPAVEAFTLASVSYTHLTLPTICSV